MALTLFASLILSIAKAGIWVSFGILIYKHYDFILLLITNRLISNHESLSEKKEDIHKIIKWIGIFVIIIGIASALVSLFSMALGLPNMRHTF